MVEPDATSSSRWRSTPNGPGSLRHKTYHCRGCGQLLPFDHECRVPDSCLERCRGRCDWVRVPDRAAATPGEA